MQASDARRPETPVPLAIWLSGVAALLAAGLTLALVWAVFVEPATLIEAVRLVLGAR
jgi:hypothetical protein